MHQIKMTYVFTVKTKVKQNILDINTKDNKDWNTLIPYLFD